MDCPSTPSRRLAGALAALRAAPARLVCMPAQPTAGMLVALSVATGVDFAAAEAAYRAVLIAAETEGY